MWYRYDAPHDASPLSDTNALNDSVVTDDGEGEVGEVDIRSRTLSLATMFGLKRNIKSIRAGKARNLGSLVTAEGSLPTAPFAEELAGLAPPAELGPPKIELPAPVADSSDAPIEKPAAMHDITIAADGDSANELDLLQPSTKIKSVLKKAPPEKGSARGVVGFALEDGGSATEEPREFKPSPKLLSMDERLALERSERKAKQVPLIDRADHPKLRI